MLFYQIKYNIRMIEEIEPGCPPYLGIPLYF